MPNIERERLKKKATELHQISRQSLGSRTLAALLKKSGESVGRYKARGLMKEAGLTSKQPGQHRYKPATKPSDIADNYLNRDFSPNAPDQVWCGDVTYIRQGRKWVYLALVIDLFARRIIGWQVSRSPDTQLTKAALTHAYRARNQPQGVLFHSDQGCHYTSQGFRSALEGHQFTQSMSRRGNCWDNSPMERVFRSFKSEWMPKLGYESEQLAKNDIQRYIKYYNLVRPHQFNDYLTPIEAEVTYRDAA